MFRTCLLVSSLVVGVAFGQQTEPTNTLLTVELAKKFQDGNGTMTEAEALKLFPISYRLVLVSNETADWKIICTETTEVEAEFKNGKLSSFSAKFDPSVTSKNLTLERFRQLKVGQSKEDVEKVFGIFNRSSKESVDSLKRKITNWHWVAGRELFVLIKDGKVSGSGHKTYNER